MNDNLNILFASNDTFSPYLGVSIYSLLEHNSLDFNKINIYIFDDEISDSSKDKLLIIANFFNQELNFIPINKFRLLVDDKIQTMKKEGTHSLTAYARLFAASLLPNIDKIIYLDVDALILGSFKELWSIELEDYYIGAVEDILNIKSIREDIGLKNYNRYINSGFLYINLKKWREVNIEDKFVAYLKKYSNIYFFHDQGLINGVCRDKILYLDPKYNLVSLFHGLSYKKAIKLAGIQDYYDEKTIEYAQKNPIFLHFSGGVLNRPWSNIKQPFHDLYYEYVYKTPFKDDIHISKISFKDRIFYRFYQSKILSICAYILPMHFSAKFANMRMKNFTKRKFKTSKVEFLK